MFLSRLLFTIINILLLTLATAIGTRSFPINYYTFFARGDSVMSD